MKTKTRVQRYDSSLNSDRRRKDDVENGVQQGRQSGRQDGSLRDDYCFVIKLGKGGERGGFRREETLGARQRKKTLLYYCYSKHEKGNTISSSGGGPSWKA